MKRLTYLICILLLPSVVPGSAATLSPVELDGYNIDEVYGPEGGTGGGYAKPVRPGDTWTFYASGAVDASGVAREDGLPTGDFASLTDKTHIYRLAPAGGDPESKNALNLAPGQTGTLALKTPARYAVIGVLATGTDIGIGVPRKLPLVLNYTDGSHSTGLMYDAADWTAEDAPANGAVNFFRAQGADDDGGIDNFSLDFRSSKQHWLYETVVEADPAKVLESITFHSDGPKPDGINHTHIFAVSGQLAGEGSAK